MAHNQKVFIPVRNSTDSRIGKFALPVSHGLSANGFDQLISLPNDQNIRGRLERGGGLYRDCCRGQGKTCLTDGIFHSRFWTVDAMRHDSGLLIVSTQYGYRNIPMTVYWFRDLIYTLRNMALVHRSWVQPVHGMLHMRHYCTEERILKVPQQRIVVVIRELVIDYRRNKGKSSLRSINLLENLPNLRSLSIGIMLNYYLGQSPERTGTERDYRNAVDSKDADVSILETTFRMLLHPSTCLSRAVRSSVYPGEAIRSMD